MKYETQYFLFMIINMLHSSAEQLCPVVVILGTYSVLLQETFLPTGFGDVTSAILSNWSDIPYTLYSLYRMYGLHTPYRLYICTIQSVQTDRKIRQTVWANELIAYHSTIQMWNIIYLGKPEYMAEKVEIDENLDIHTEEPRLINTRTAFRWRTTSMWNTIPTQIRELKSLPRFKSKIKIWLIKNREIRLQ